jgi:lipid II:glycine glycyltransferase (peptidoglycan interpeptide bridge formation enzyme)
LESTAKRDLDAPVERAHRLSDGQFVETIWRAAKREGVAWIRIEPSFEDEMRWWRLRGLSVRKAPHDTQPREILAVSIQDDESSLLARMKSKTRYNIRLAEKKGVRVFASRQSRDVETFCDLIEVTAARDGIVPHSRAYYRDMFAALPEDMLTLCFAEYRGKVVAANSVVTFGTHATYLHGASSNAHRDVMAPYLLQWRQMQDAKQNGCRVYDFGGISTGDDAKLAWSGITRFKQGFAPESAPVRFPGSFDVLVSESRYAWYTLLQQARRGIKSVIRR